MTRSGLFQEELGQNNDFGKSRIAKRTDPNKDSALRTMHEAYTFRSTLQTPTAYFYIHNSTTYYIYISKRKICILQTASYS